MKLSTIILHVTAVPMLDRCRDWYLRLGLSLSSETPGESYWFNTGPMLLGIHTSDEEISGNVTIYLDVPDVDEMYARLSSEFEFAELPSTKVWGGRVAYLRDPLGNRVGLVAPGASDLGWLHGLEDVPVVGEDEAV